MPLSRIILTRTLGFLIPKARNPGEQSFLQTVTKKSMFGVWEGEKARVNMEFSKGAFWRMPLPLPRDSWSRIQWKPNIFKPVWEEDSPLCPELLCWILAGSPLPLPEDLPPEGFFPTANPDLHPSLAGAKTAWQAAGLGPWEKEPSPHAALWRSIGKLWLRCLMWNLCCGLKMLPHQSALGVKGSCFMRVFMGQETSAFKYRPWHTWVSWMSPGTE